MDIAFCISGQLRDEDLTFPHVAGLARDLDATVFISTWRRRGAKSTGIVDYGQACRIFGNFVAGVLPPSLCDGTNLNSAIPGLAAALDARGDDVADTQLLAYFPDAVIDIEEERLCLDFRESAATDVNSMRMLYKIWRCNELKRVAEKARGRRYDAIIRFRPDIIPTITNLRQLLDGIRPGLVHIPGARDGYLDDVLCISCSEDADTYASLFGKALLSPKRSWKMIHFSLADHLKDSRLQAEATDHQRIDLAQSRQRDNRRLLLGLMTNLAVRQDFFKRPDTWLKLATAVEAATILADGGPADQAMRLVNSIDLMDPDLDLLRSINNVLIWCFQMTGDRWSFCASRLTSVLIAGLQREASELQGYLDHWETAGIIEGTAASLVWHPSGKPLAMLIPSLITDPDGIDPSMAMTIRAVLRVSDRRRVVKILSDIVDTLPRYVLVASALFEKAFAHDLDLDAAAEISENMVTRFPTSWQALDHLGHVREKQGRLQEARTHTRQALDLAPDNGGLMTRLGMIELQLGKHEEAERLFRAARDVWKDDRPWIGLVEVRLDLKEATAARLLVEDALRDFPDSHPLRDQADRIGRLEDAVASPRD